jgi:hypothetical protein
MQTPEGPPWAGVVWHSGRLAGWHTGRVSRLPAGSHEWNIVANTTISGAFIDGLALNK